MSKVMESRRIFLRVFRERKAGESSLFLSWLAMEGTAGLAASLVSRILSFAESAALSRRLSAEFPGMPLEVVPFGYSSV